MIETGDQTRQRTAGAADARPQTKPPPPDHLARRADHPRTPNNELPQVPGTIWPPLPGGVNGKACVLVWVVLRVEDAALQVVIDTNAEAGNELPPGRTDACRPIVFSIKAGALPMPPRASL